MDVIQSIKFEIGDVADAACINGYQSTLIGAIEDKEITVRHEMNRMYQQCIFERCHFILEEGARADFYACSLKDCSFDPPLPDDGGGFGAWSGMFHYSAIHFGEPTYIGSQ